MIRSLFALVLVLCSVSTVAADDVVRQWNKLLCETIQADATRPNPGWSSRAMAMMNGAMYDALMAIDRTHAPFLVDTTVLGPTSIEAALATAAYKVTVDCYVGQTADLTVKYGQQIAALPDDPARAAGIALGEAVAAQYIAERLMDGSEVMNPWPQGALPGEWRSDPFHPGQAAWGPDWKGVQPFALQASDQFPVPPVPALDSPEYTAAFNEVKSLGEKNSLTRTDEQTEIGVFWGYDRQGTGPPPVLYNENLDEIAEQQGNTLAENARMYAMASVAMADASIAAWDAKFRDNFWRPVTGIQEADTDGNPDTEFDEDWEPLGAPGPDPFTPPFPAYVSGHATFGAALFTALANFYGSDAISFDLHSGELPGVVRHYTSFSQASQENADSRIYLGIHWRFDATEGISLGNSIGDYIFATQFLPVPEPSSLLLAASSLIGGVLLRRRLGVVRR